MKIGFFGPTGTYSHEALEVYSEGIDNYTPVEFSTIYDALNAVDKGKVDCSVVPIENSIEGSVNSTLDILAESDRLRINAEIFLEIKHSLIAKNGTKINDIDLILSHPQAIAQCSKYLRKKFSGVPTRQSLSTAEGAREVMKSEHNWAAISNPKAAKTYGLEVLDENIQDSASNVTRFVVVSLQDSKRTGKDKTSVVFSTDDEPGSLYRVLDIFNLWDLNLTKIESRPAKNELGKYIFLVDFTGHRMERDVEDALTMVKRKTSFLKILGSYYRVN